MSDCVVCEKKIRRGDAVVWIQAGKFVGGGLEKPYNKNFCGYVHIDCWNDLDIKPKQETTENEEVQDIVSGSGDTGC